MRGLGAALCLAVFKYTTENTGNPSWIPHLSLFDTVTNLPSYGINHLHFFGLLESAPPPGAASTKASFLDTQLLLGAGYAIGLLISKLATKRTASD
jgi:hypothetical protein